MTVNNMMTFFEACILFVGGSGNTDIIMPDKNF